MSMSRLNFSRRVVFAFTIIVLAPLFILFAVILLLSYRQSVNGLESICNLEVRMNEEKIYEHVQTYLLVDKMIRANSKLLLFITSPEDRDETEVINTVVDETLSLERILSVEPSLYAIRIFTDSPYVPERFPVILQQNREDFSKIQEWEFNYKAEYLGFMNAQMEPSVCLTHELSNGKRHVGYVQVAMRTENFFPFMHRAPAPYQNDFVFRVTGEGEDTKLSLLAFRGKTKNEFKITDAAAKKLTKKFIDGTLEQNFKIHLGGRTNVIAWRYLPDLGIAVAHTCEASMVGKYMLVISLISFLGFVATGISFYFIVGYTANRLFKGLYSVMGGMEQVSEGNLGVQIPLTGEKEVLETQKIFNSMTSQLSNQIEQIKTEQQLIADTEMKAMQNQINAHFLYNVLETIHMQAVLADDSDVAESILILGKMLRYCLRWRVHTVTLDNEMEYIQAYVSILNIRNDYTISLEDKIPAELRDMKIPKMLLQPFVENAFVHAIEPLANDSVITIYSEPDEAEKKLWLCVQDYGVGMEQKAVDEIMSYLSDEAYERDSTGSIGIKNIQQRLTMFYGPEFRLKIISEPGKGTLIKVPLPYGGENRQHF